MIKSMFAALIIFALLACFGNAQSAYVYRNNVTGDLLYCSNDQGDQTKDFEYVGTAQVDDPDIDIVLCELEGGM